MAEKIGSLTELATKLQNSAFLLTENMHEAVARSAVKVQATAKNKFGHYQPAIGGFPAWAVLSSETLKQKFKAGGGDDPLIGHYATRSRGGRSGGALRNSILVKVDKLSAAIGTNDKLGPYHEYGTRHIPPRPFLRPALYQEQGFIQTEFRKAIVKTLKGI